MPLKTVHTIQEELERFHFETKHKFVVQINLLISSVFTLISIFSFFYQDNFFEYYLITAIVHFAIFLLLKRKPKLYKTAIIIQSIFMVGMLIHSIVDSNQYFHFQEAIWITAIAMVAFFVLNKKWSIVFLTLNIIIYLFYFSEKGIAQTDFEIAVQPRLLLYWVIQLFASIILIAAVMFQFRKLYVFNKKFTLSTLEALKTEKEKAEKIYKERASLVQEVNFRVKGNLQIIVNLLEIQAHKLQTDEAKDNFREAINRINTMSMIHERMFEANQLKDINLREYFDSLLKNVIQSSQLAQRIVFNVSINSKNIQSNQLIPIGLIINELTSNSIKHAFHEQNSSPCIELTTREIDKSTFQLEYFDNGTWSETATPSFGLELIKILVEQLEGKHQRKKTKDGTKYTFTFTYNDE